MNKLKQWLSERYIYLYIGVPIATLFFIFGVVASHQVHSVYALIKVDSSYVETIRQSSLVKDVKYESGIAFVDFEVRHYNQVVVYIDTIPHGDDMIWEKK